MIVLCNKRVHILLLLKQNYMENLFLNQFMIRGALKQITSSAHHRIFDDPSGGKNTNKTLELRAIINLKPHLSSGRS